MKTENFQDKRKWFTNKIFRKNRHLDCYEVSEHFGENQFT